MKYVIDADGDRWRIKDGALEVNCIETDPDSAEFNTYAGWGEPTHGLVPEYWRTSVAAINRLLAGESDGEC